MVLHHECYSIEKEANKRHSGRLSKWYRSQLYHKHSYGISVIYTCDITITYIAILDTVATVLFNLFSVEFRGSMLSHSTSITLLVVYKFRIELAILFSHHFVFVPWC